MTTLTDIFVFVKLMAGDAGFFFKTRAVRCGLEGGGGQGEGRASQRIENRLVSAANAVQRQTKQELRAALPRL